ncbi:MAG: 16S rRNA (guanine(966)-N(2))-methyltransferase RsmD [Clostridiales bacterium]|jgi:16S rRNA (guanine966-N2)-methyltransferase|nr:16S rRNA (guanine(966)-N(2))-methyltransferase RsmD [Clostridiales bacterium]
MRVISGKARGVPLYSLEGLETRPTADRVKETIFNIIQYSIGGINFLDICSGSGAMGIEAISRGAHATFIEASKKACTVIHNNLEKTKLSDNAAVINNDAVLALKTLNGEYSIIYIDPPYENDFSKELLTIIEQRKLLKKEGSILLEQGALAPVIEVPGLNVYREKAFKKAKIIFYQYS